MKKIFFWCPYLTHVGTINAVINSAIAFSKINRKVYIISAFGEWDDYFHFLKKKKIKVVKIGNYKKFLRKRGVLSKVSLLIVAFFSIFPLIKILIKEKPDYIIANLLSFVPILSREFIIKKNNIKIYCSIQGLPKFNFIRKIIWKIFYKKADIIICLTRKTKQEIKKKLNFKKRILVIDNPLINSELKIKTHKNNFFLKKIKIFKNDLKILGIGRLTYQKNFSSLIKAAKLLKDDKINFKLFIIGEGEEKKQLNKLIKFNNLSSHVFLLGFIDNPLIFYKYVDLYICSSRWEEPGHTLIESAYMKTPIISSDCPNGPREILSSNAGILYKNNNYIDLYNKIKIFHKMNKTSKKKMIKNAYLRSLDFSEKVFLKKFKPFI